MEQKIFKYPQTGSVTFWKFQQVSFTSSKIYGGDHHSWPRMPER